MKNTKALAKNFAVEYFKDKAMDMTHVFTIETYKLIEKFEELKEKLSSKEQKIAVMRETIAK